MKKAEKRKNIYMTCCLLSGVVCASSIVYAATQMGSVSISYSYDGDAIPGANVDLYSVASWTSGSWVYIDGLDGCEVDLSNLTANSASEILEYLKDNEIEPGFSGSTNSNGKLVLGEEIPEGLYVVAQNGWADEASATAYKEFNPFLISIPLLIEEGGTTAFSYTVEASPKSEKNTTTAEEETTPEQEETTPEQDETTTASDETTTASDETTTASDETTTASDETTTASDETTTASDETTTVSDETTPASEETTPASDETTTAVEETTPVNHESTADGAEDESSLAPTTPNDSTTPNGGSGNGDKPNLPITGMVVWPVTVFSALGVILFAIGWVDNRRKSDEE